MPIRVGSRLEQLLALRRRVDVEIEQERRAEALRSPGRPDTGKTARVRPIGRVSSRADAHASLARLGVTPAQVREWGNARGFELAIRGSLPIEVVEAYVETHVAPTYLPGQHVPTCESLRMVGDWIYDTEAGTWVASTFACTGCAPQVVAE